MKPDNWQELVVASAKSWINTPYVPRARVKGVGVDCGGLLYEVYNPIFGPFVAYPEDYAADWALHVNNERYLDFIMPYVHEVDAPVVGGFTVFHFGLNYAHGAIFIGDDYYIHAWGRQREGRVAQSKRRAMYNIGDTSAFPPKHYEPN